MAILIDFDGVLNQYKGYEGDDILFEPARGVESFLDKLQKYKQPLVIHTARNNQKVENWLLEYGLNEYITKVTSHKVPGIVLIDDRVIQHNGNFKDTLNNLKKFKVHWSPDYPFDVWRTEEELFGTITQRGLLK
jgi:adenylylsulfate kinase